MEFKKQKDWNSNFLQKNSKNQIFLSRLNLNFNDSFKPIKKDESFFIDLVHKSHFSWIRCDGSCCIYCLQHETMAHTGQYLTKLHLSAQKSLNNQIVAHFYFLSHLSLHPAMAHKHAYIHTVIYLKIWSLKTIDKLASPILINTQHKCLQKLHAW